MENLLSQLKRHEGFRPNYYRCSGHKLTIGYGRNVDNNPFTKDELAFLGRSQFDQQPLTKEEAEYLLKNDINRTISQIQGLVIWEELNRARKAACTNMAFQLGVSGFRKFANTIEAINDAFFERAAREMLDSVWSKQTPNRALELSEQMRTGEWQCS